MGYKVLGFVVWRGGKWYLRRRLQGKGSKAAIAGVGALALTGAALAARQAASGDS
jgi:hypothetical protein